MGKMYAESRYINRLAVALLNTVLTSDSVYARKCNEFPEECTVCIFRVGE
jgi:hypothetical protein